MKMSDKEIEEWEKFVYETTPAIRAAAASGQPVTINITLNVDNSVNIQSIVSDGRSSARLLDARHRLGKYLPPNYQPTSMDEVEQRLFKPMTKEEQAALPWQCFGP